MCQLRLTNQNVKGGEIVYTYRYKNTDYFYKLQSPSIKDSLDQHLVANVGLALTPYLFNLCDYDQISVETSQFTRSQLSFFEKYLLHGMAEFRHVNGIDPDKPIEIISPLGDSNTIVPQVLNSERERALLMMGGGKDSLVSKQILDDIQFEYDYFTVNENYPTQQILNKLGEDKERYNITIVYDERVRQGELSGHKPGSSIWAFISLLVLVETKHNMVISSNEYSANFPQIVRSEGIDINHQYTKSYEFEKDFSRYVQKYLASDYRYFSLLRSLYELQISKIFAQFGGFFDQFISCNVAYKAGKWCKECAKCAFVYCILAPFLTEEEIAQIWGMHVLQNELAAEHIYNIVSDQVSPLECIGTKNETLAALQMLKDRGYDKYIHHSYRRQIIDLVDDGNAFAVKKMILFGNDREDNLPRSLRSKIHFDKYLGV